MKLKELLSLHLTAKVTIFGWFLSVKRQFVSNSQWYLFAYEGRAGAFDSSVHELNQPQPLGNLQWLRLVTRKESMTHGIIAV